MLSSMRFFAVVGFLLIVSIFSGCVGEKVEKPTLPSTTTQAPITAAPTIIPAPTTQPQIQRINVGEDDDAFKGYKTAPVTMIEFSDFQCPFCAKFWAQTFTLIEQEYIKKGKVKFVYRDFPLDFHEQALNASIAAECAKEQGKFWEMHDKIYAGQNKWSNNKNAAETFKIYASELNLGMRQFNDCSDSGKYANEVLKDLQDGIRVGVGGTPTFFINGIPVRGAQPFEVFRQIIEAELAGEASRK